METDSKSGPRRASIVAGVLVALTFVAVGTGVSFAGTDRAKHIRAQDGASVSIVNSNSSVAFQPAATTVTAGSTVTWRNNSVAPVTVTADNGSFDSGQVNPGGSFSVTFPGRGVFRYLDTIHVGAAGTVTVV
jgi:plastocyanin